MAQWNMDPISENGSVVYPNDAGSIYVIDYTSFYFSQMVNWFHFVAKLLYTRYVFPSLELFNLSIMTTFEFSQRSAIREPVFLFFKWLGFVNVPSGGRASPLSPVCPSRDKSQPHNVLLLSAQVISILYRLSSVASAKAAETRHTFSLKKTVKILSRQSS